MYEVNTTFHGNQPHLGRICHTNDTLTLEEIGVLISQIKLHIYITKEFHTLNYIFWKGYKCADKQQDDHMVM